MNRDAAISLWDQSSEEQDYANPMRNDATADVAVVGGGFTGLSTALHCGELGLSAHVLEAHHIDRKASCRERV